MSVEIIPCLQSSYDLLKNAIHNEVVFITGPPSTGKTTIAKKIFQEDGIKELYLAAYVDCYSVATPAKLLSMICQGYQSQLDLRRNDKTAVRLPEPGSPVNLTDFPRLFEEYYEISSKRGYKRLYVIMDHVELFHRTNLMDTFVALCRLNTQSLLSLRMVIISYEDPSDIIHYVSQKSLAVALSLQDRLQKISLRIWSIDDTIQWIMSLPPVREVEVYSRFVKNVVTLSYLSESKDPRQIRIYCQQNFSEFLSYRKMKIEDQIRKKLGLAADEPVSQEDIDSHNRKAYDSSLVNSYYNSRRVNIDKRKKDFKWTHNHEEIKMPVSTSTLIVAAYIAAYTKPADDKWNFITFQRGKRAKKVSRSEADITNRPFTLERLVQIWIRLTQQSIGVRKLHITLNNDCVLADVERLQNLNILHHLSGYELSSDARYRLSSNIMANYVERLAAHSGVGPLKYYQGLNNIGVD